MDIARYIGLFLLKNHFCYIHGLGNLEMKKKSAFHDGTSLNPPAYEVIITPGGSIDDTLANFIATNEQISISKAASALRDFSTQAKADLQEGKEVVIPSLGKFVEHNGKVSFITDPHIQYTPPGVPVLRNATRQPDPTIPQKQYEPQEQPAEAASTYKPYIEQEKKSVNWGRIALIAGLGILVVICVIFTINYFNAKPQVAEEVVAPAQVVDDTMTAKVVQPERAANVNADGTVNYKILLHEYNTEAKADRRVKALTSYGYNVEMVAKDSATFYVLMPITTLPADTTRMLDSVARVLNPSGVSIYNQ